VRISTIRAAFASVGLGLSLALTGPAAAAAQPSAPQGGAFKSAVDLVNIGVTVTDKKGVLVTDLTAADFEIVEDGRKQSLGYFAGDGGGPTPEIHLGVLLDVSESMGEDIAFTRTAAIKFLNTITDAVDITVVDFDTQVRVGRFAQRDFARVVERIRQQKTDGNTAMYDAIGLYIDGASAQTGRKIMLLYTDGGDTRSALRFGELLDLLKASDVTVYAIGVLEHQTQSAKLAHRPILQQIAEATGGQAFFPLSAKNLDAVYAQVVAEIRAQYTLGYVSTNPRTDGSWRKVEIKVARKDGREYRVRARKGYYAAFNPAK
jgi:Ca-activated chloride channel family protein